MPQIEDDDEDGDGEDDDKDDSRTDDWCGGLMLLCDPEFLRQPFRRTDADGLITTCFTADNGNLRRRHGKLFCHKFYQVLVSSSVNRRCGD